MNSRIRLPLPRRLCVALFGMGFVFNAQSESLLEMYQAAQSYDASYQAAQAQLDAVSAKAEQVISFYFGSSASSQRKDEMIHNSTPIK